MQSSIFASSSQRFDPRACLLAYLIGSAAIVISTDLRELVSISLVLAVLLSGLRLWGRWWHVTRMVLPTLVLFALVAGWSGGSAAAVGAALRLLALISAGLIFFATTAPEDLGDALLASGVPSQVAFLLEGALRFVPTMGALAASVRDAQASRGIRFDGMHLLRNGLALLGPILISAMRLADDLAEGLETRGFGGPRRTPLRAYRYTWRDWGLLVTVLLLAALVHAGYQ